MPRAGRFAALLALVLVGTLVFACRGGGRSAPAEPAFSPTPLRQVAQVESADPPQVEGEQPLGAPVTSTVVPAPTPSPRVHYHTVAPGETVRAVAERYSISVATVVAANDLEDPDLVREGQELRVPAVDGVLHTLQPGETVREVAERYGVATGEVVEANGLTENPDVVAAGTLLVVPGVPEAAPEAGAAQSEQAGASAVLASVPAGPRRVDAMSPPAVTARYVAIVDEESGAVLYGEGEHDRVAPASVTKIATTLVALEREPDLGRRIHVEISGSEMAARDHSSIMGLEPGDQVSLKTLLFGMMLPSGNDAAEQVALALGSSRDRFVEWMNEKAAALGLKNTHFANPSGMDADGHYSSAYDMAMLGRAAMRNETFRQLVGAATYRGDGFSMTNLNRLIGEYPGADGIKIGRTRAAGRTIVASATRGGHRVYISLMRSRDLTGDSTALFDWVWHNYAW
jgi:LysM repeat protein